GERERKRLVHLRRRRRRCWRIPPGRSLRSSPFLRSGWRRLVRLLRLRRHRERRRYNEREQNPHGTAPRRSPGRFSQQWRRRVKERELVRKTAASLQLRGGFGLWPMRLARRPDRSELLGAALRFQGLDDRADVLGAIARNDQERVAGIDHAEAAKPERRDEALAFREHDAVVAVDGERVAAERVSARIERAHFGKRGERAHVAPAEVAGNQR